MRKKVINFLYMNKRLKFLLPIFHFFIGKNRVKIKSGGVIKLPQKMQIFTKI